MTTRRGFLAGLIATGLAPMPTWADAGSPDYLAAAQLADGTYGLFGLTRQGAEIFHLPLPDRGHAASAHPIRPEAVAFARRPGRFAVVLDCRHGDIVAQLEASEGRHFYGHGAFSADGALLYTTENDYDSGLGRIGIWDAAGGYARIGEISSGGVGPHDIALMPDGKTLVIANGGIDTHPDTGRQKLNLPTMLPNLTYLVPGDGISELVELPAKWRQASIRHLAVRADGLVGFGMQWQGEISQAPSMVGIHKIGGAAKMLTVQSDLNGYVGSIAFAGTTGQLAVTSPRGNLLQSYDVATGERLASIAEPDICGLATSADGLIATSGTGRVVQVGSIGPRTLSRFDATWDNHLVPLKQSYA